ncbi:hypothetical protein ETAA8_09960 [Anatilimnocola aggregata]|uniref:Calpain catalytic domain-containing protein n=1 Tax=Anatilimnocola aggregata TaxID=2528021 RepID=A0A517Y6R0_9BACT|nr:C2 family cysteine protease [Anatilimnocola aggregata]QDU25924.1 hypothetical protein ETAA8_09960 [Anatilimnocola aggregata]
MSPASFGRHSWQPRLALYAIVVASLACGVRRGATAEPAEFLEQINLNFAAWDQDSDGVLSVPEIDTASADAKVTGKAAAALAALKRASRVAKYKSPLMNKANIEAFATGKPADDKPNLTSMYGQGVSRLNKLTKRELFPDGLPRLDTVHQGRLGNCYCLAPLGAVLHRNPQQVMAMFTRLDDGNYRVTLGKNAVTIALPTDTEIARTATNEDAGIWVNMYEKALGTLRNDAKPAADRAGLPIDALARGGSAGTILAYITGNEITRFSFRFAKDEAVTEDERKAKLAELREQLIAAVREKRVMTCGTLKPTMPGITGNHAYAVLGYDAKFDAVKIWNPYGNDFTPKGEPGPTAGYPRKQGVMEIPLNDFVKQFSSMSFEVTQVSAQ